MSVASSIDGEMIAFVTVVDEPAPLARGVELVAELFAVSTMSLATGRRDALCPAAIKQEPIVRITKAEPMNRWPNLAPVVENRTSLNVFMNGNSGLNRMSDAGPGGGLLSKGPCRGRQVRNRHSQSTKRSETRSITLVERVLMQFDMEDC